MFSKTQHTPSRGSQTARAEPGYGAAEEEKNGRWRLAKRVLTSPIFILGLILVAFAYYRWVNDVRPVSRAFFNLAEDEYQSREYEKAIQHLTHAYRLNPFDPAISNLMGWCLLRTGKPGAAQTYFIRALSLASHHTDARLGLGLAYLSSEQPRQALGAFALLPARARDSSDVRLASARAYIQTGENRKALGLLETLLSLNPDDGEAHRLLAQLAGVDKPEDLAALHSPDRPAPAAGAGPVLTARVRDGHFETAAGGAWNQLYVTGFDLGTGTPGHFATEAPTDPQVYLKWFEQMGKLNANSVRIYTLLPPAFYNALLIYNRQHRDQPLYLFQEIWLDDPPGGDLFDAGFTAEFTQAVHDVVDAVHGRADIPIRRGHAGGIFSADVSPYVLGWLVGREVEPHVVIITNQRHPKETGFAGRYLSVSGANAAEVWLVKACDDLAAYETERYHDQHPVSFVNWPPLDPLHHPTETSLANELDIRRKLGEKLAPLGPEVQDDNDAASIDEEKVTAGSGLRAGYFGVYHVYPFWPDFLLLDPVYRNAKDSQGLDAYWGYLQALRAHYKRTPILIAEYGLSTSLGIAHFQPNGWNHGGLSEKQQGQGLVRLSDNIRDAGFMGGLVFEWADEWWKHNWIAADFEKPFERKPLWHNEMDPEQDFGINKWEPAKPVEYTNLEAPPPPSTTPPNAPPAVTSVQVAHDAAWLYLDLGLSLKSGQTLDWSKDRYLIALNTCGQPCGSAALPGVSVKAPFGPNFAVTLDGPDQSKLLVADTYNPYREFPVGGIPGLTDVYVEANFHPAFKPDAPFEDLIVETNRRRYGRDGTYFPAIRYSRSLLRYADFDRAEPDYDSLGEWYFDSSTNHLRLRLAWGLLMVMDPSEGNIFYGTDGQAQTVGRIVNDLQVAVVAYAASAGGPAQPTQVVALTVSADNIEKAISWPWPKWSKVDATLVPKTSYSAVGEEFGKLTESAAPKRGM